MRVFIGLGFGWIKSTRFGDEWERKLVEKFGNVCVNAFYMAKRKEYYDYVKTFVDYPVLLDNGAYQSYRKREFPITNDLLIHFARLLNAEFVVVPDVLKDVKRTRENAERFTRFLDEFKCLVVLQGACADMFTLLEDIDVYKSMGYRYFAFPYVVGGKGLVELAKMHVPYLHGLGCVPSAVKSRFFDSIDVGSFRFMYKGGISRKRSRE